MPIDEGYEGGGRGRANVVPIPDPSLLTTQNIREAVEGLRQFLEVRLDGMDDATALRLQMFLNVPADIDARVGHLRELLMARFELHDEKFRGIAQQFSERDTRTVTAALAADDALKAAFGAAKELGSVEREASNVAALKSENNVTKQVDQITALIQTGNAAADARITELKERLDRGEGNMAGAHERNLTRRADNSFAISVAVAAFGLVSVVSAVITLLHK